MHGFGKQTAHHPRGTRGKFRTFFRAKFTSTLRGEGPLRLPLLHGFSPLFWCLLWPHKKGGNR
jgi:hypothetical protein